MSVYGVPKPTTYHKIHRKPKNSPGGQTSLTNEEEQLFIDHLIKVSDWGFSLLNLDLHWVVNNKLLG